MPIGRMVYVAALLISQSIAAPADAELAWPGLCARLEAAGKRQPD